MCSPDPLPPLLPRFLQPPLMQMVFWGTPAPGLDPGQVAAQVCL